MKLKLEEYKGKYQIVQGYESKNGGGFKPEWCTRQKWSENDRKMVDDDKRKPLAVYLGTKENAVAVLKSMLIELTGNADPFRDKDIPF